MHRELKIFSGTTGRPLAKKICEHLGIKHGDALVGRFNDGEIRIRYQENIRESDVFIVNSTNPQAENLLEMILLSEAARESSAGRITLVIPYFGYSRQDRKDRPRVPISARMIAKLLSIVGASRVLLLDLHAGQIAGYFDQSIVTDHLYASWSTVPHLKDIFEGEPFVVASPDAGGVTRAKAYARQLGAEGLVIFSKERSDPGKVDEDSIQIIGNVNGKRVLFVDDIIDSAGTMCADARVAEKAGAIDIRAYATHGIFSQNAIEKLGNSPINEVVVTDTITHLPEKLNINDTKISVISVSGLLAEAIHRLNLGGLQSISALFNEPK